MTTKDTTDVVSEETDAVVGEVAPEATEAPVAAAAPMGSAFGTPASGIPGAAQFAALVG
jgi:hypothetical protein